MSGPGTIYAGHAGPVDPYLRWAELTGFQAYRPGDKWPAFFSFIIERDRALTHEQAKGWQLPLPGFHCVIPPVYDAALPVSGQRSGFATLQLYVPTKADAQAICRVLAWLVRQPTLRRLQFGHPRNGEATAQVPTTNKSPPTKPVPVSVVIGLIDDGIAFAHPGLLDEAGQPRIAALWQQGTREPVSAPWWRDDGLGYGRMVDAKGLDAFMQQAQRAGVLEETLCYEAAYAVPEDVGGTRWLKPSRVLLGKASHGTSVLAVAAGRVSPLQATGSEDDPRPQVYGRAGDPASQCPLIAVDLPREQTEISSGRWLPFNGLDALRFILQQARSRFQFLDAKPVPVVVNLSSGSSAGAHAGEAMFERAMDELLTNDDQLAIVLAAGNSRIAKAHARMTLAPGTQARLGVFVPPLQPFATYVEFWLPAGDADAPRHLEVEACMADGGRMVVTLNSREAVARIDGTPVAALLFHPQVVQAVESTMVLLAVAGTVVTSKRRQTPAAGPWMLTFRCHAHSKKAIEINGWVERDEVVAGQRREQIARFFTPDEAELKPGQQAAAGEPRIRQDNTLSNIATGRYTAPVAALRRRAAEQLLADYSGLRKEGPGAAGAAALLPYAAVADAGRSHPGVRVDGNRAAVRRRMNGTSVAAPQAARHLAGRMATGGGRTAAMSPRQASHTPAPGTQPPPTPPQQVAPPAVAVQSLDDRTLG